MTPVCRLDREAVFAEHDFHGGACRRCGVSRDSWFEQLWARVRRVA